MSIKEILWGLGLAVLFLIITAAVAVVTVMVLNIVAS